MQPRISAGAYFATSLVFLGFAVTFFLAATVGPVMIGFGITFTVLTILCLVAAYRIYYGGSVATGVSYQQFMKTRERLQKELASAQSEVERLTNELEKSKPREIDAVRKAAFSYTAKDRIPDLLQKAIYVYTVPTAFDSQVLAGHIVEALKNAGVHAIHLQPFSTFMTVLDPLQSFGLWVFGDEDSALVRGLVGFFRDCGLLTVFRSWSTVRDSEHDDKSRVWIIVGDRGDGLRGSRYDSTVGGDLAG